MLKSIKNKGLEFERKICQILRNSSHMTVSPTPPTKDKGIDCFLSCSGTIVACEIKTSKIVGPAHIRGFIGALTYQNIKIKNALFISTHPLTKEAIKLIKSISSDDIKFIGIQVNENKLDTSQLLSNAIVAIHSNEIDSSCLFSLKKRTKEVLMHHKVI